MKKNLKYNLTPDEMRLYHISTSCIFKKNNEKYGGFSNMSTKFPVRVNSINFKTIEALYQCLKFVDYPQIQMEIIEERSPMRVKMISNKYHLYSRSDWEAIRVAAMKWCLNVKFAQNVLTFTNIFAESGSLSIVENSANDNFWGAVPNEDFTVFEGKNALGRLLMDLRLKVFSNHWIDLLYVQIPKIENFNLLQLPIEVVDERANFVNSLITYWQNSELPLDNNLIALKTDINFYNNLGIDFNKGQTNLF